MARPCFPQSVSDIRRWAARHELSLDVARRLHLHGAVLACAASDPLLADVLILRGAAALRLFYGGQRDTRDLDFLVLNLSPQTLNANPETIKPRLNRVLNQRLPLHFEGEEHWDQWLADVHIDLSACEMVCECTRVQIARPDGDRPTIKVCTLEEIIAEKLIAMLSSAEAEKKREQDLFDVASVTTPDRLREVDLNRIVELGRKKAICRLCSLERDSFTEQVRERLRPGYETIASQSGRDFIPFEQAWSRVTRFVAELPLA